MQREAVIYYGIVWSIAFMAGVARALHDRRRVACGYAVSGGVLGAFLAVSVVCFCAPHVVGHDFSPMGLGISAAIGVSGPTAHRTILAGVLRLIDALIGPKGVLRVIDALFGPKDDKEQ